jgi:P27 family predicted phage terminase small subunit
MGNWNSGRRPQPKALKILRGNPGKRRLGTEVQVALIDDRWLEPPPELRGDRPARDEWRRLVPLLRDAGLLTQVDRGALVGLCQQWSAYLGAHARLRTEGPTAPALGLQDRALTHCLRLWAEFGLTPSSRTKLAHIPAARTPPASKWGGSL